MGKSRDDFIRSLKGKPSKLTDEEAALQQSLRIIKEGGITQELQEILDFEEKSTNKNTKK